MFVPCHVWDAACCLLHVARMLRRRHGRASAGWPRRGREYYVARKRPHELHSLVLHPQWLLLPTEDRQDCFAYCTPKYGWCATSSATHRSRCGLDRCARNLRPNGRPPKTIR